MESNFFQKVKRGIKEPSRITLDSLLCSLSWRLPSWLFNYVRTYVLRSDNVKLFTRKTTSYFQKFATLDDAELLQKAGICKKLLEERLEHGDRCYFVGLDNKVLSIIWGSTGKRFVKFCGAILDPGDDGVIMYGGFSDESVKLKGLFPLAYKALLQSFLDDGRKYYYAAVHATNKHSYKMHQRMNFEQVGESFHFVFFGIKLTYYKTWPHKTKKLHIFIKKFPDNLFWN